MSNGAPSGDDPIKRAAVRLYDMHIRHDNHSSCWWCFKPWPCADRRWAEKILQITGERGA